MSSRWADCVEDDPETPPPSPRTTSNNRYIQWLKENPCTQKYFTCLSNSREWTRLEEAQKQAYRQSAVAWQTQTGRNRSTSQRKYDVRRRAAEELLVKGSYETLFNHASLFAPKSNY